MRENKINVYESFQAVIKKLKKEGKRVICYGVSNGGLLSSYTLTQIPEYIEGAVIGNPVIDLMRFHRLLAGQGNSSGPEIRNTERANCSRQSTDFCIHCRIRWPGQG